MLQLGDCGRIPHVIFAVAPPLVEAAALQPRRARDDKVDVGDGVPRPRLFLYLVYADAADARGRPREEFVYEILVKPDRLEYLRAAIALDGGYAHLRHYLDHALARRLQKILLRRLALQAGEEVILAQHVLHRLEDHVRVDRARAVSDEKGEMGYVARLAGFHDDAAARARPLAYQAVVDAADRQQAGDGRVVGVHSPVGQNQDGYAARHRVRRRAPQPVHRLAKPALFLRVEQRRKRLGAYAVDVDGANLLQLGVGYERLRHRQLAAVFGRFGEQIALRPYHRARGRDQLFAYGIERRVGYLREPLAEVVEQNRRAVGHDGERDVRPHRADGVRARERHRLQYQPQVFERVAESRLAARQRLEVRPVNMRRLRQVVKRYHVAPQPFAIRTAGG